MRRWRNGILGAVFVAAAVPAIYFALQPSDTVKLQQARRALAGRNYDRAETLALSVAHRAGSDPQAWMIAGEAAAGAGHWQQSLQHYEQVSSGSIEQLAAAAYGRGEACVQLGRLERAELEFQRALKTDSKNELAKRRLADLLVFTGRKYRAAPLMDELIQTSRGTLEDLFHLGDLDHLVSQPESIWATVAEPNSDPLLVMGAAFQALMESRPQDARVLFERVLKARPTDVDAQAGWGEALLLTAPDQISMWRARLSPKAADDAGLLAVLAQLADQDAAPESASQLYARVVVQRPTSRIAWHRLGTTLNRLGRTADAELALRRAQQLHELGIWLNDLFGHREHLVTIRRVAERLYAMGRVAEAAAWSRHAVSISPNEAWALQILARLEKHPRAVSDGKAERDLARLLKELTEEPITPTVSSTSEIGRSGRPSKTDFDRCRIHFVDRAKASGLEFVFRSARDSSTPGARIIETTGGGVGILDYDGDGWPDLYFTQGSRTFPLPAENPDRDRLFRNRQGQSWVDVSAVAGIDDAQFGQGVAVGDFNNDGFPDLYVGNYGVNGLYQNQGDGTFQDVTPQALRQRKVWTSSCVVADLNGDGWPDLFDVTYCQGNEVETRLCDIQGTPRSCSPRVFGAELDRLWLNTGDGGWELAEGGLSLADGLGLGVLAFRSRIESPLGLFIANDEVPNFWLVNMAQKPGDKPQWEDRALEDGLAVDADGQAQACMGVACDDANGDGFPDLFVTNFYQESNTLYLAVNNQLFEDRTRTAGLRQSSWNMLGFGTQFIDADLDGWPDLLVANGHIDDLSSSGIPFEMPPQCFHNRGGVFRELTAEVAGDCFARRALGRGMARLDWNRDSREDAVIVNQESTAALLTNASESTGRSLVLQFRATAGARDAIGTIVRAHIGARVLTRQVTAGDGYQASNERQLVIGIGSAETADRIEVFWPDGSTQEIASLAADQQYLFVQDRPQPVRLPVPNR